MLHPLSRKFPQSAAKNRIFRDRQALFFVFARTFVELS